MTADSARLREASGAVEDDRPLVAFLYLLMRGHLPAGVIATLLDEATRPTSVVFTNGWLARYAQDCADRLHYDEGGA